MEWNCEQCGDRFSSDKEQCPVCGGEVVQIDRDSVYEFRGCYIPRRMMEGLRRYIEGHCPVGDFLTAVLENNLSEAVGRADDENASNLAAYIGYLYNEAPSQCWGSPEKVSAWLSEGRK